MTCMSLRRVLHPSALRQKQPNTYHGHGARFYPQANSGVSVTAQGFTLERTMAYITAQSLILKRSMTYTPLLLGSKAHVSAWFFTHAGLMDSQRDEVISIVPK